MIFPITYSAPIGQDRDFVRPADRPAGATVNESRALIALAFGVFGLLTWAMPTSSDAGLFTELPAGSPMVRTGPRTASRAVPGPGRPCRRPTQPVPSAAFPASGRPRGPPESMPDQLHPFPAAESVTVGAVNVHAKRWNFAPYSPRRYGPQLSPMPAHDADLRESQQADSASGLEDRSLYTPKPGTRSYITGSELGKRVAGPGFEPG